ncbi:MAG: glycoside hydrolase family 3 N-terminal domain-containing protein [Actinomycetota bacterium]|nr:glycoside hydrolase family 3 N-terminal domain-containing protein [Actinomycetota bacterium]
MKIARVRQATQASIALVLLLALSAAAAGCGGTAHDGNGGGNNGGDPPQGLTLEQKVGQLFLVGFEGTEVTPEIRQLFEAVHPGGVILFGRNITDEAQLTRLVADLQELAAADTGQPLFIAIDQEGGEIVRAGWIGDDTAQARIASPQQAYDLGLARARGLAELGVNLNLAPVLDMGVPGDFLTRYGRTFSGEPQQVGELGASAISGQRDGGVLSTAKHFPGYGGIDYDPENERLAVVPDVPEYSQFLVAAAAGPELIMTANVVYTALDPDLPFTLSPSGIAFLREKVDSDYLVISDDLATKVLKEAYGLEGTVTRAVKAGVDVLLISGHEAGDVQAAYAAVLEAVRGGGIAEEVIDERVTSILHLKALGVSP